MWIEREATVLGYPIRAVAEELDEGWDVSVYGGCKTHIGAVSFAEPGGEVQTLLRENHRDDVISMAWAAALADSWQAPVCVRTGIHFDGIIREDIALVVQTCNRLLSQVIEAH